jgi:8-oxo-dGTP pyrophosphatase MutT (NUDIX family)
MASRRELRPAAVLIPLVSEPGGHQLLLTRRARDLRRQPGDISFPGGAIDEADPTPLAAALRESEEEVGLKRGDVNVLGQMDERETVTGFRITPFVGAVRGPYPFKPNHEVAELILAPIATLRQPGTLRLEYRILESGAKIRVYHYLFQGHDIWGITGRLIKELLDILPPPAPRADGT